ncbi:Gfo/Idh/MocA family oxidoreductase [Paenibacillus frigoriresistens]|uniref:Gfo/Idh/MocA family protein n=1 Tax=Paenibacillus alginolyticus TaxID=59839 RepID=UPI00156659A0|nr:Gfo/Idh/MocA family oxidoreductase [Paenibacillus frigoriresistens]NRF93659.1 Gfo/Idh/MocA family oxidoreductase [Paenibacillus frigoriresistens]
MYKAIVIGLGQIGLTYDLDPKRIKPSSHTLAYYQHPQVNYVAATDPREAQKSVLHSLAPEVVFYSELRALLKSHEPDIVSICTPPISHVSVIKEILSLCSPKVIFCEKPIVGHQSEVNEIRNLMENSSCMFIPNLSRRWSSGIQRLKKTIDSNQFGRLNKIHTRYTRGIFNTGSHMFDIIRWLAGDIEKVMAVNQIETSSDKDQDPSFTFLFECSSQVSGYGEAFSDNSYYMFEMDFYFEFGKVSVRESGNKMYYYQPDIHPLFSGFQSLKLISTEDDLLSESHLGNAVRHIVRILDKHESPVCNLEDGLYPIFVANALLRSKESNSWEKVTVE